MAFIQDTDDHYYIDAYNLLDTPILQNGGMKGHLEGTQRLYTTDENGDLDKCIMIAPYIEPMQYVGRNAWSDSGGTFMDQVTQVFQGVMSGFNDLLQNAKSDLPRMMPFLRALLPNSFGKIDDSLNIEGKLREFLNQIQSTEYKAINIGEFKRQYQGSSVEPPVTSLSALYFSNDGDFQWFNSTWMKGKEATPLRKMCAALLRMLVGDVTVFNKGAGEQTTQSIVQYAPMGIQSRQLEFQKAGVGEKKTFDKDGNMTNGSASSMYIANTFAIVTGDVTQRRSAPKTLYNLLPESITIAPSRMLTPDNDYYYVKIDVTFSLASYIGAKTVADSWITSGNGVADYSELFQDNTWTDKT